MLLLLGITTVLNEQNHEKSLQINFSSLRTVRTRQCGEHLAFKMPSFIAEIRGKHWAIDKKKYLVISHWNIHFCKNINEKLSGEVKASNFSFWGLPFFVCAFTFFFFFFSYFFSGKMIV